jgi:tRNA-specific adenosine deaminase 1
MAALDSSTKASWIGGHDFRPFDVKTTHREFSCSRRSTSSDHSLVTSNLSTVYTPNFQETLVGGVLQGRKPSDPRGASQVCRKSMWAAVAEVAAALDGSQMTEQIHQASYSGFKGSTLLSFRRNVKADVLRVALKGWVRNDGDGEFSLDERI